MNYKVFVQFSAARGPEECNQACYLVFKKFIEELETLDIKLSIIDCEEGECYGYKSIFIGLDKNIPNLKKKWEGTIKYICTKNHIRPNHKRKNWFVGCKFYEYKDNEVKLDMKDVRIDLMRASGAGGQYVNRTESCVRLTHIPTGITVVCQAERSQIRNKEIALQALKAKINNYNKTGELEDSRNKWLDKIQVERGNEVLTFKGEL